jgi:LysM repeat protein
MACGAAALLMAAAGGGCTTMTGPSETELALEGEVQQLRGEVTLLRNQVSEMRQSQDRVLDGLNEERSSGSAGARRLEERVQAVERGLGAESAAREQMRTEIVEKVIQILKTQAPTPSRPKPESGYEHIVKQGETLSAIAAAYKVSVGDIKKANNLRSDVLRVGQKLFIPDKPSAR